MRPLGSRAALPGGRRGEAGGGEPVSQGSRGETLVVLPLVQEELGIRLGHPRNLVAQSLFSVAIEAPGGTASVLEVQPLLGS